MTRTDFEHAMETYRLAYNLHQLSTPARDRYWEYFQEMGLTDADVLRKALELAAPMPFEGWTAPADIVAAADVITGNLHKGDATPET